MVGCGILSGSDVPSRLFSLLEREKIKAFLISAGEMRISALIPEKDAERAVKAVHAEFFGANG